MRLGKQATALLQRVVRTGGLACVTAERIFVMRIFLKRLALLPGKPAPRPHNRERRILAGRGTRSRKAPGRPLGEPAPGVLGVRRRWIVRFSIGSGTNRH